MSIVVHLTHRTTLASVPGATVEHTVDARRPLAVRDAVGRAILHRDAAETPASRPARKPPHTLPARKPKSSAQRRATWGTDEDDLRILAQIGQREPVDLPPARPLDPPSGLPLRVAAPPLQDWRERGISGTDLWPLSEALGIGGAL